MTRSIILFALAAVLAACSNATATLPTAPLATIPAPSPAPITPSPPAITGQTPLPKTSTPSAGEEFRLKTEDNVELFAKQWKGNETWVVLSSNGDGKSERWQPLVDALNARGYSILIYDWRGTNAGMGGTTEWQKAMLDARAAIAHANSNNAKRFVLIGGSLGGIASIKLGGEVNVAGVVALGAPYKAEPLNISQAELARIKAPKLFIGSSRDGIVPIMETQWLYDNSPAPKFIHIYDGDAHGVNLFESAYGSDVIKRVVDFVNSVAPAGPNSGAQDWREDLVYLADAVRKGHPKPFYKNSEAEFNARIQELYEAIPNLNDNQIKAGLLRICAMFDGHTRIFFGQAAMNWRMYGMRLYQFSDGLFVVDAMPSLKNFVGLKLISLNGVSTQTALAKLTGYVEHDNESWLKFLSPAYLMLPELLQVAGIVSNSDAAVFELQSRDGTITRALPAAINIDEFRAIMPLFQLPIKANTLWLTRRTEAFWMMPMPEKKALYIQYNQIRGSNNNESLAEFVNRAMDAYQASGAQKLIVDLRHNGGGDNNTYFPMLNFLRNENINQTGKLFVLTGRNTFSAASNFLTEVEKSTRAIIVGEPMGSSPNLYGDTNTYTLPHSKIEAWISARYWEKSLPTDTRDTIEPKIKIEFSSADWFAGRDPVLEAALNY